MQDITRLRETNRGGMQRIYVVEARYVLNMVHNRAINEVTSIALATGIDWSTIEFTRESLQLKERTRQRNGSVVKEISLEGVIPKDRGGLGAQLDYMERHKWVVLAMDKNLLIRVIGTQTQPAVFTIESKNSGKKWNDMNAQEVSFKLISRRSAPTFLPVAQAYINSVGQLVYDNRFTPLLTFSVVGGNLIAAGPDSNKYSLNNGRLIYTP
jgi:hypothetical protein